MATTLSIENRRDDNSRPTRASIVDYVEVASGKRHRPTTTMTVADTVSIDDDEATFGIAAKGTTLSIENRRDDNNGRPTKASIVSPRGTFLALHNDGGNAGDAVGKARGRAEDGGVANAGLDGLLSVAASDATATSSYSRSAGVRSTTTMTVADTVSIDDDEATFGIAGGTPREDPADGTPCIITLV